MAPSSRVFRFLPLLVLVIGMVVAYTYGLHTFISLENFHTHKAQLMAQVSSQPVRSALLFSGVYAVCVALSLPIATLLTLIGGFLFGSFLGTVYVVCAATLGASILFIFARSSFGALLQEKAGPLYKKVASPLQHNAVGYMLFMRLVPLFPFALVNLVAALANVRPVTFVWTTLIGIIPGSFVYVNVGGTLGQITSLNDIATPRSFIALGLLGAFALIPTLYNHVKKARV